MSILKGRKAVPLLSRTAFCLQNVRKRHIIVRMDRIDGRFLRDLRSERGYSLRDFAQMVYSSKSAVQRWEKSSVPENEQILKRLSEIFDLSVERMRELSKEKYGEKGKKLSPEQAAEIKFGTKSLWIAMATVLGLGIASFLLVILL